MNKETNPSFFVDHTKLKAGLYQSKEDWLGNPVIAGGMVPIQTWDLRFKQPYVDRAMTVESMHAIEHMMAVVLRETPFRNKVIYFGPMGCCTGCYLVVGGQNTVREVQSFLIMVIKRCLLLEKIPAQTKEECGNYLLMSIDAAKKDLKQYLDVLLNLTEEQTEYPLI